MAKAVILPTKHLLPERALITIASQVHALIKKRETVSSLWSRYREEYAKKPHVGDISYDWFVLSLDLLFMLGLIDISEGFLTRTNK